MAGVLGQKYPLDEWLKLMDHGTHETRVKKAGQKMAKEMGGTSMYA